MNTEKITKNKQKLSEKKGEIAIIGAGIIGAGWCARFIINGYNVAVFDPSEKTQETCIRTIENAQKAMLEMTMVSLPKKGDLRVVRTIEKALEKAIWVQESVPEREELKKKVLAQIENHVNEKVVIASSTSGLLPTKLQKEMIAPERFIVAHPFNPVYLLPLVELVGGSNTDADVLKKAAAFYQNFGMKTLLVRKEIDAFIADRLLEAIWREALWLVKDQVASTEEIDNAIKFGFGLRWAQMGLFETYRIAGGQGGFKHFLEQFAPALKLPWSKLTNVPEWSEKLQNQIVQQSDKQADGMTSQQLERIRDKNLAAIINALKAQGWGAGKNLIEYEQILARRAALENNENEELDELGKNSDKYEKPLCLLKARVEGAWLDANGHMNESRYLQVFSNATDRFLLELGFGQALFEKGYSFYTLETNLRHWHEAKAGEKIYVDTRLLASDAKKLHLSHAMYSARAESGDDLLLATAEHILLHVLRKGADVRSAPMEDALAGNFQNLLSKHSKLPALDFSLRLGIARKDKI